MEGSFNELIGARIRSQREYLGMSRDKLCEYVNISPQFLSEIERGKKGASAETLYKLCNGLGASADFILMGKEKPADVSNISAILSTVDEKYIPLAEEMLKAFFKAISIK